jgi:hypothetical protein
MGSTHPTTSTETTTSVDTTTSTDTTISPETTTSESCEFQFPGFFQTLPPEVVRYIIEHVDMDSILVLMLVCKVLTDFLAKNSWNILCLSGNKKPAKELVKFVTRASDMKTRIPVLRPPGILKMYKDIQINAVIITAMGDSFPECSLSDVSSMVIHLPRTTYSDRIELAPAHRQFLDSLPIDKFSSLGSLMSENIPLTDGLFRCIGNLKVEEMHWNYVSSDSITHPVPMGSLASVKRVSGKYTGHLQKEFHRFFPFAEKMVIHSTSESQEIQKNFSGYTFDLSESKSLQYL